MAIVLTGHTSGIGKYIFENFDVIGCSRSNGFNILYENDRRNILNKLTTKGDVLINSAHSDFGQTWLLLDFFYKYRWQDKKIICVGSTAAEHFDKKNDEYLDYIMYKRCLKNLCDDLENYDKRCRIFYINLEYVFVKRENITEPLFDEYLTLEQASNKIIEPIKNEIF